MPDFRRRCCDRRPTRRDLLRIGALTAFGMGLCDWLGLRALAKSKAPKAKACILLWLDGGPSHLEMFDPKPEAPSEVRGPFQAIDTAVPGIRLSECLPMTARQMREVAIVRSMTSPLGEHGLANHYMLTGYSPTPALQYPSYGSVLVHERNEPTILPRYVAVPDVGAAGGAGYLGPSFGPFAVGGDPAKPGFQVRDLDFYPGLSVERIEQRRRLTHQLDELHRAGDQAADQGPTWEQAFRLLTSPDAKTAFDVKAEPDSLRNRYGSRTFGQSCLLARRLVERGVPFVTVTQSGWDTHGDLVLRLKEGYSGAKVGVGLLPTFDQGFATLIADLKDRGLLETTLVIAMGEFGRTPKLNSSHGRDHWPRVFSIALAGGGIRGGQIYGASDRVGENPADHPMTPNDLAATIYMLLGVDPNKELHTSDGRPVRINSGGRVVNELLA